MSAILSADDLNDFINPGIACIKPVETLPKQRPDDNANPYEVTTEDKIHSTTAPPAQISLTDCLACSGCVTSAEAVLVSLQSHSEVLQTLDMHPEIRSPSTRDGVWDESANGTAGAEIEGRIFVASISPQTRASLAATYNVSEREAGHMITQLLSGPLGLRSGGVHGSGFTWVVDTNVMREACLVAAAEEVQQALITPLIGQKKPILTSACPGWICYAEKTHPHILPHLSKLKSPQALTGTILKSVLARRLGVPPGKIWHMAVMPCFDKKLEASRAELTSSAWYSQGSDPVRDVDCVITARELLMLAESWNIKFPCLPRRPLSRQYAIPFPDDKINDFLFDRSMRQKRKREDASAVGTSGGYLHHILKDQQARSPGSAIITNRGRNADVSEYSVIDVNGREIFKAARYYGFRNIQNLVRRLKPAKASRMRGAARKPGAAGMSSNAAGGIEREYAYVEVMACPGGCTNGGGQIKVGDVATLRQVGSTDIQIGGLEETVLSEQKEWLSKVDEAYWSAESEDLDLDGDVDMDNEVLPSWTNGHATNEDNGNIDGIDRGRVKHFLDRWAEVTGVDLNTLLYTTYKAVESDVRKSGGSEGGEMERVSALAVAAGGGW